MEITFQFQSGKNFQSHKTGRIPKLETDIKYSCEKVKQMVHVLETESNFSLNSLNNRLGKCLNDLSNTVKYKIE